jgi:hypothetical protein
MHECLDPAMCGSGPVRGEERRRRVGNDMVPYIFYGIDAVPFPRGRDPAVDPQTSGYVRELSLGNIRH